MNKSRVFDSSLITPIVKLLVPTRKSHFRIYDDRDCDNWNVYKVNAEKITIYGDNLVFKNYGKSFTLRGDVLKMITDFKFETSDLPDAKLIIDFRDEIRFDIHGRGKSLRYRNLLKNYFFKGAILASGLKRSTKTIFILENPNELCGKVCWIIQEKQAGNDTKRLMVKLLLYLII